MPQITEVELEAYQNLWKEHGREIDDETAREEAEYLLRLISTIFHSRYQTDTTH